MVEVKIKETRRKWMLFVMKWNRNEIIIFARLTNRKGIKGYVEPVENFTERIRIPCDDVTEAKEDDDP